MIYLNNIKYWVDNNNNNNNKKILLLLFYATINRRTEKGYPICRIFIYNRIAKSPLPYIRVPAAHKAIKHNPSFAIGLLA